MGIQDFKVQKKARVLLKYIVHSKVCSISVIAAIIMPLIHDQFSTMMLPCARAVLSSIDKSNDGEKNSKST